VKGFGTYKGEVLMYNIQTVENVTMDRDQITHMLKGFPLGGFRFFDTIDSTNNEATRWIDQGAPDMALVVADEQTRGKGRFDRRWLTPPGAALAFSLVLRGMNTGSIDWDSDESPALYIMRMTGLGAVAVCEALESQYSLTAQIKWPNDVLLEGRKTSGILSETIWQGEKPVASVLGVGVNVASGSVPPDKTVRFPATCVEQVLSLPVDRYVLLRAILESLISWRQKLDLPTFIQAWDERLAYKGEWVDIIHDPGTGQITTQQARVIGIDELGRLRLQDNLKTEFSLISGELSLKAMKR
jgi:BirA family biotin operon repressor/biotin-[acetyl-CoA-carboxylase] ligase